MKNWKNGYFYTQEEKLNNGSSLHAFSVYYNKQFVGQVVPRDAADEAAIIKVLDAGVDPIAEGWEDVDGNALEYPVEI